MYKNLFAALCALLLTTVVSCSSAAPTPPPSNATLVPVATEIPTLANPTIPSVPSQEPTQSEPTQAPTPFPVTAVPTNVPVATEIPTLIPPVPTARPVTVSPTQIPRAFTRVKIFLIALNDGGKSGPTVGCGDSAVAVERQIAPTSAVLTAALNELLSLHDRSYGESGLYNALYQSDLHLKRVDLVNGMATIQLTGKLSLGGECDDPRVAAQITNTALQFATVRSVAVRVNGVPLEQLLGGK